MDFPPARGLPTPIHADPNIALPDIRWNKEYGGESGIGFLVLDEEHPGEEPGRYGWVRFEGLEALKCCNGEMTPYRDEVRVAKGVQPPWILEVADSPWLEQHGAYIRGLYQRSLEDYVHYVFSFHDEWVEAIARGIWLEEKTDEGGVRRHPSVEPVDSMPREEFVVEGCRCAVRRTTRAPGEVLHASKYCSQVLFQYEMEQDGKTLRPYTVLVRTVRGRTSTRIESYYSGETRRVDGLGREGDFHDDVVQWVSEFAARRRESGRSP